MNFDELLKKGLIFGLIAFALISFIGSLQTENPVSGVDTVVNHPVLNKTYVELNSELGGIEEQTNEQKKAFTSENPITGLGELVFLTIVGVGKVFSTFVIGIYNVIVVYPATLFGVDPLVISIIGSLLVIVIIIGLWLLWRATRE